jgi:hypothetical protein
VKTFLIASILLFATNVLLSQEKTLLTGDVEHGGYGAPVVKFTQINDQFGLFVGARGGWIINHSIALGIGGYGLANNIDWGDRLSELKPRLMMGYGGFEIEIILNSDDLIHFTFDALIGSGAVNYWDDDYFGTAHWDKWETADVFFVAEPAFNVDMNITSFFRVGVGASYRFISGVETLGLSNEDLSGFAGNVIFKFGSF